MSSDQAKINKINMENYYENKEARKISIQRRAAEGK
jgi:hypothetical protein